MLRKRTYYVFIYLLTFFTLQAQQLTIPNSIPKNKAIESIIIQSKDFEGDTLSLKKYLSPLSKSESYKPLYHALFANGITESLDQINDQSNYHYLKSIALANKSNDFEISTYVQLNYIDYLYNYRDYTRLTPLFLDLINKTRNIESSKMIFAGDSFKKIAWILQTFGDYQDANHFLQLAKTHTKKGTPDYSSVLNTIGKNYLYSNDLKKSAYYFNQSAYLSKRINDTLSYAKALGYLAEVYQKEGDFKKAISLLKKDISLSQSCGNDKNTMFASTFLSELYLQTNEIEKAEDLLNKATLIAYSKSYYSISELKILKLKLAILQKKGRTDGELILRRRITTLEDLLKFKDGETVVSNSNWMVKKSKVDQNIKLAKLQYQEELFLKGVYAFIALLAVLIAMFIYFNFKKKIKIRQLEYNQIVNSLELGKVQMEQKLCETNEDLQTHIDYVKNKNIQIKKLKNEIEVVRNSSSYYLEEKNGKLKALLESHLMTENNWRVFKKEFEKAHPDFYQMVISDFKEIKDSNLRILCLEKLDFNTNEIGELLGVTPDAIKKSKQRLKKKLGNRYEELYDNFSFNSKSSVASE